MPTVPWEPHRRCDEDTGDPGNENHTPGRRRTPVQPMGNDLPDEVDDVVNRRLEDDGCDGDRHPQKGGGGERTKIRPAALVDSKILWAGWRRVPREFGNPGYSSFDRVSVSGSHPPVQASAPLFGPIPVAQVRDLTRQVIEAVRGSQPRPGAGLGQLRKGRGDSPG